MGSIVYYKRDGRRVPRAAVEAAKANYVQAKRTGDMGGLRCSIQPAMADAVEQMSLTDYCSWSGQFTYRRRVK